MTGFVELIRAFLGMKLLSSESNCLSATRGLHRTPPLHAPAAVLCVILLSTLLVACGGSSGSDPVSSDSLAGSQDDGTVAQAPPAPSTPDSPAPATGDGVVYNLGGTPQTVIDQCMSETDKAMLTRVNIARSQARNCGAVAYPATAPLSWHCTLADVALGHSRDMGDHNFISHTGSDGLTPGDRVTNAGYDWSAVAENIAAGQATVDAVMTAWLDSPGHCVNIMRPGYTEFGAAAYSVEGSDFSIYWTQVLATPRI